MKSVARHVRAVRGAWPVGLLLLASVAGALWAAQPFWSLARIAPEGGTAAAGIGAGAAIALVVAVAAVGALVIWLARKDARRVVRWFLLAAVAFGLLLLLVPLVASSPAPWGWVAAIAAASTLAWLTRGAGWPTWSASALAAGGYAGLLAAVAGLPVLAAAVAAVALYDTWAVRRTRMARVADAAHALEAPLQVGEPARFSLGLGDLILPAALVAAAADPRRPHGMAAALGGALGLAAGFVALAWAVRRGGDTPGTPYLCGGALAGIAAGLLAAAAS
jgi:presenilin-like A22 family membrane protease